MVINKLINTKTVKSSLLAITLGLSSMVANAYDRIVAMSPDVADILVALGSTNKIVGKDTTNTNPALRNVPSVGIHRHITAESVIAVRPDLVLGSYMVQPQSIYQRLNGLNVKAVNVSPREDVSSFANSIKQVGQLVGKAPQANRLSAKWVQDMTALPRTGKRYILSYDGRIVAGRGTVGDELIRRAGGVNAAANVSGLKPLTREGWLAAKPDIIIIASHHRQDINNRPEVLATPAGRNNNIKYWSANDFLRFGLDSPQTVRRLHNLAR
ncbi:heme/hemin ABC transporter substrate-binding protein [Psychrobacter sp. I-STPA6b]|uniref:heme/hemin ABC transporter substrate-binding protein n=1 Tax=Psychrobacter sp. I-STPA6b TaxID=2585718 RepID=UPI001D0C2C57|nr:ABC transporter substrate-binding protein [Psychrobacter sp. I-STPA6b]